MLDVIRFFRTILSRREDDCYFYRPATTLNNNQIMIFICGTSILKLPRRLRLLNDIELLKFEFSDICMAAPTGCF